jgi:HAD superfamily hydrolase (TIGR01458 family)
MKKPIRAVLIDLSGTLHVGNEAIPGAREALRRLRENDIKLKFVTNTSTKSTSQLLEQLNDPKTLNFGIARNELVTSVLATASYVERHSLHPLCLMEDTSDFHFDGTTNTKKEYDSVVVGLAPTQFHYEKLNEAFRILLKHPTNLIAIHRGNYYKDPKDHQLSIGPGGFVAALETSSSCKPAKVMGKPSKTFFESAMVWEEPVHPDETCMIGDDVTSDCGGAKQAGIATTILVQTGKYRPGDETKLQKESDDTTSTNDDDSRHQFLVRPSIVEAVEYIILSQSCK